MFRQTQDVPVDRLCLSAALLFCKRMSSVDALFNPVLSPVCENEQAA